MLSTLFVFASVCLFGLLFAFESADNASLPKLRPASLITWLVSGNWPAKVGAGLLILGIGALLRYALINVDAPPELKLGSGFVAVAILGMAASYLKPNAQRRAIYLALSGTAFAVAYLTAYAAYSFFHYLNSVSGLALLVVVSAAAGVFAVSSRAMSVAILAMAGAYIAPKFASNSPSPAELYGYYLAISAATLLMVRLRGWRPLIHLSFLFTLAGALFFGWTFQFYQPEHYLVMQPLLLALTALHLAMPIAEKRGVHSQWLARFDTAYFTLLPLVAAGLTLKILPEVSSGGGLGFGLLALLWFVAAAVLGFLQRPQEALRHAFVAVLLSMVAGAFSMSYMLRLMAGLALAVTALGVAPRLGWTRRTQDLLCGAVMLIGALHIVFSIMQTFVGPPFVNEIFAERALVGVLMGIAAWLAVRSDVASARYLTVMSVAWSVVAIVAELQHVQFDFLPQAVYAVLLVAVAVSCGPWHAFPLGAVWRTWLLLLVVGSGIWAADGAPWSVLLAFGVSTPAVLLWVAFGGREPRHGTEVAGNDSLVPSVALGLLPVASAVWVFALAPQLGLANMAFEATLLVACALVATIAAEAWIPRHAIWYRQIWSLHFGVISAALLYAVLLHIERGLWPVFFEVLALVYMVVFIGRREKSAPPDVGWEVIVIAIYLVTQAMLLRLFGPAGTLNASDILQMKWPAAVSLLWALLGVGFCWWGAKCKSRAQWSSGMALLALATFKLVFRDLGTLDQLGNILALIGVGLLFLAVAWFAPIPPAVARRPPGKAQPADPLGDGKTEPIPLYSSASGVAAMNVEHAQATAPAHNSPRMDGVSLGKQRPSAKSSDTNWLLIIVLLGLLAGVATVVYQWQLYARTQAQLKQKRNAGWRVEAAPPTDPSMADPNKQAVEAAAQAVQMTKTAAQSAQDTAVKVIPPPVPIKVSDVCTTFTSQLPSDYVLYAGGNYKGSDLDFQIDKSGHTASQFEVWVNEPGQKVVLALGAYEPSVWNIHWTAGTVISGVFVSGYHRQVVAGLSREVPVLNASYEEKAPCGYFYMDSADVTKSDTTIRKVLGRSAKTYFLASAGKVTFGAPVYASTQYVQSVEKTVDSYRDKDAPLTGQAGIEQLIREGKLRRATESDMQTWKAAVDRSQGVPKLNIVGATVQRTPRADQFGGVYVVLKAMRFPAGLYGAHSVTFMVPRGGQMPEGNPGHSAVLDLNQYP